MLVTLRVALSKILSLLRPGSEEGNFDEELRSHLDMAIEDKISSGMSPAEARRRAHLELGNLTQLKEAGREVRSLPWVGTSWLDVKLGLHVPETSGTAGRVGPSVQERCPGPYHEPRSGPCPGPRSRPTPQPSPRRA